MSHDYLRQRRNLHTVLDAQSQLNKMWLMTTRLLHHFRGNDEGEICGCLVRDGRGVALVMLTGSGHKAITILAQKMKNFAMIQDM
jgi:hypothetical protein